MAYGKMHSVVTPQTPCSFGDMAENVKIIITIPMDNFLYFHHNLNPRVALCFASGEKIRSYFRVKPLKLHFRGQGQSVESEK